MVSLFKGSSVIELTPKNFDKNNKITHPKLDGSTKGMIIFSASFCGYCQRAAPEYMKTSYTLGMSFPLFSVDCEKYPELTKALGIVGYPTIKYINKNGSIGKVYNKERSLPAFLGDICKEGLVCK